MVNLTMSRYGYKLGEITVMSSRAKFFKLRIFNLTISKYQAILYYGIISFIFLISHSNLKAESLDLPKQGIRSNVLWPIFPGGKFRFAYRRSLHDNQTWRTDLLLGIGYSAPERRSTEGTFTETSGILGFRQFFSSPWHFEFQAAYGRSNITRAVSPGLLNPRTLALGLADTNYLIYDELFRRKSYSSLDLELMGLVGYEWKLSDNWSIDLQAGVAKVVSKSDPWPTYADSTRVRLVGESAIPVGVVNITYWF
jgi:hypothetical protein